MATRIKIKQPIVENILSANDVRFLVIHYTAGDWKRTKYVFEHPEEFNNVSVQFVIDTDGTIDELIPTRDGSTFQANHSGFSFLLRDGICLTGFNRFSIGVELVNLNGNLLPFSEQQYQSLISLISELQVVYPNLRSPESLLGHDHIAICRGKCDPGIFFNWDRLIKDCYPDFLPSSFVKPKTLPKSLLTLFEMALSNFTPEADEALTTKFWHDISATMENTLALMHNGTELHDLELYIELSLSPYR